ncbi:MAG: hypothetical protein K0S01_1313 [Herbinix sp.]|nr:hypothetical protein [Herbinix sp.]
MNIEIIIENINRIELDNIIFKELNLDRRKIKSSHFYDEMKKEDINMDIISSLKEFYTTSGTGNIYIKELDLGICIHNVMIIISFDKVYGDIVLNFEENELLQKNIDINKDYVSFIRKSQNMVKNYDIGAIIIGYEPASDEDMQLVTFSKKEDTRIIDINFPTIMNEFKKIIYSTQ